MRPPYSSFFTLNPIFTISPSSTTHRSLKREFWGLLFVGPATGAAGLPSECLAMPLPYFHVRFSPAPSFSRLSTIAQALLVVVEAARS